MSIVSKKKQIFGKIAAARTLTEGMPKLKLGSSFPSINNAGDSITFLTDLIKSLIGYDALIKSVVDILTNSIDDIEVAVKQALKIDLKSIVSCGIDPSLPSFLKQPSGTGIVIQLKKIDFVDLMKTDPNSDSGKLLFGNITSPLTNSRDFNTFLAGVIQDDGNFNTWKDQNGVGMLDIKFVSKDISGVNPNNSLTILANPNYNSKTLNDLNNNYIDSLKLFDTKNLVNNIIDTIFGSISTNLKKTVKQLDFEGQINSVVGKMINSDAGNTVNNDPFKMAKGELSKIQSMANDKQKGLSKLNTSTKLNSKVPEGMLTTFNSAMDGASSLQGKKDALTQHLNFMSTRSAINAKNPIDVPAIKLNFVQEIINNLIKSIVGVILSPKVIMIFVINFKIVYGLTADFGSGVDFIKKNKQLINRIIKKITTMIIQYLLKIALKRIAELVGEAQIKKEIDKQKNKIIQLLSLTGIPPEALRIIKGLA